MNDREDHNKRQTKDKLKKRGGEKGKGKEEKERKKIIHTRPRRLRLRIRVSLPRSKPPDIVRARCARLASLGARETQLRALPSFGLVQELLVPVQALGCGSADDGRDGPPLGRHELGQVEQFLVLIAGPLDFADAGVEPFGPAGFALFGGLPGEKRGHALPLVQAVF